MKPGIQVGFVPNVNGTGKIYFIVERTEANGDYEHLGGFFSMEELEIICEELEDFTGYCPYIPERLHSNVQP